MSELINEIDGLVERHNGAEGNDALAIAAEAGVFLLSNADAIKGALVVVEKLQSLRETVRENREVATYTDHAFVTEIYRILDEAALAARNPQTREKE